MVRSQVTARVQVTVDLHVHSATWDDKSIVSEIHREAELLALKEIERLCQRYVTIVGVPKVTAVITEKTR